MDDPCPFKAALRTVALAQLQLEEGHTPEALGQAILREALGDAPRAGIRALEAARILRNESASTLACPVEDLAWELVEDLEEGWREKVERFAETFFDLSIEERCALCNSLHAACKELNLQDAVFRLERLQAGLRLETPLQDEGEPVVGETARAVARIFVLPTVQRFKALEAFVDQATTRHSLSRRQWTQAESTLRRRHPEMASLLPDLKSAIDARYFAPSTLWLTLRRQVLPPTRCSDGSSWFS
jgi:hypothetical protein